MIINGGSRSNGAFFARHLLKQDNERVTVIELRGLTASTVPAALREMKTIASGTRAKNYLYHASLSPDGSATLTQEQWSEAADILERHLGLTGQPCVVVEHVKSGRTHRHIVWSRIDADTLTARSDSLSFARHERASREIEQRFGHPPVPSVLVKDRKTPRPQRRPTSRENFRGQESGLNPQAITADVTALWHAAATGTAFASALRERGYILAAGDRRDFVIVDRAGADHSLARRITGIKAADIRTRLADLDRAALPTVTAARAIARQGSAGGSAPMSIAIDAPITAAIVREDAGGKRRAARPPRVPAPDPATAAAQVRQVTAQYARRLRRGTAMPPCRVNTLPRRTAARDVAEAAAQIEAITRPFVLALVRSGIIPAMVTAIIDTGISWAEQVAHYAETYLEDVRDIVMGRPGASRG